MDALLNALAQGLSKADNIGLIVSVLFNVGLAWAHVLWRREERADRQKMLDTFNNLTEALNGVKNVLAAQLGRPV